jgi:hypothetical protein
MSQVRFKEVLRAPLWLSAFIYFMLASLVLAIWVAFNDRAALVSGAIALLLGALAIIKIRKVITFDGQELKVGSAHIERSYLTTCEVLDGEAFRRARTRDADPAAFFALTFWVSKGVKISLNDPRDPTPYWLISTQRGAELKKALEA